MDYSVPGLLGILVGVIAGVASYYFMFASIQRRLRDLQKLHPTPNAVATDAGLSVTRRITLTIYILLFGTLGYWAGRTLGS